MWRKIGQMDAHYYKKAQQPEGATVVLRANYAQDDQTYHDLEVIRPSNHEGVLPVIVMIHGGGWVYGDIDSYYRYYSMELAKFGYAIININYRLAFDHPFPAQIEDVFMALNWIEVNAQSLKLDAQNVFFVGDSAGAHLAALSAQIQSDETLQNVYGIRPTKLHLRALGLSCGVYDFTRLVHDAYDLPLKDTLMEVLFNQEDYQNHPLYLKSSVSNILNDRFYPCYVVSSKADPLTLETQLFIQECKALNLNIKTRLYPKSKGLPHVFNLKSIYPQSHEVNSEMIAYFNSFLG